MHSFSRHCHTHPRVLPERPQGSWHESDTTGGQTARMNWGTSGKGPPGPSSQGKLRQAGRGSRVIKEQGGHWLFAPQQPGKEGSPAGTAPQDQSTPDARRDPDRGARGAGSQAPPCAATCAPVTRLCQPRLQAWEGSLSPRDRFSDLRHAPATPAPLNFQKRKKKPSTSFEWTKTRRLWHSVQ